ncbi:hypothetical protein [Enterovirga sp.]|jgi:hypothetical protein|uniref:hypothetical protein n=1 Tax=Enterovirga sp. TaxID=2026350 RepID=UPI0026037D02|nr:hypothetical protein [Enterovirga sp.]MDB5591979.1 hypothetical protein [Enterovirga sp.]
MEIGRLLPIEPRTVWRHEALDFTPWLAGQLDRLGEAINEDLELLGSEQAVGPFSADIVARNKRGETVLIENQLEKTDHSHLGQLMTYLAGLEAKTIIWVSTRFQAEHVSAMQWLNDHTPPDFRFFAVELRVVRIGDSPVAPIFDVVVRPNDFERDLKLRKAEAEATSDSRHRDFWALYMQRHPGDEAIGMKVSKGTNQWLRVAGNVTVGTWLAKGCGVYVRGQASVPIAAVVEQLAPYRERLEAQIGAPLRDGNSDWLLVREGPLIGDPSKWPEAADWLHRQVQTHFGTLREVLASAPAGTVAGPAL